MDLFAEFKLLNMGERLGRFIGQYRTAYFTPDKRNGQIIFSYKPLLNAEKRIYEKISDITISMRSTELLKMPELITSKYPVVRTNVEPDKISNNFFARRNLHQFVAYGSSLAQISILLF